MTSVDVILDHYLWKKKIKNPKIYIKKKIEKLSKLNLFKKKPKNHTIFLTNNRKMKALNKKFRNKNNPTDVLSFPFQKKTNYKKNIYLGDVAISYEIINKRSKNSNFFNLDISSFSSVSESRLRGGKIILYFSFSIDIKLCNPEIKL